MHIVMTVNAAWNIWNFRRTLVEALSADGHRITVLAPTDDAVTELEGLGCRICPLEMSVKGLNPMQDLKLQHRFRTFFETEAPDVVLSFTIKNNIFGAQAARRARVSFIPNVTGLGTAFLSGKILQGVTEQLYRRAFKALPIVFFQNNDDRDLFVSRRLVSSSQTRLLPGSGIDLAHFAPAAMPLADERPVFLMIARLLRDKGVMEFVAAARQLKERHPNARFHLLGAAGSENRTAIDTATVEAWVEEGVIKYLGTTDDVRPFISEASCVVLPSYREGSPRTLIEAAAMARPLIATDVPGCRAVVDRDITGFLCEPRNSKSLAEAMERFIALSAGARRAMGQAGRLKMERQYDQALVVAAYREALADMSAFR